MNKLGGACVIAGILELANQIRLLIMFTYVVGILTSMLNVHLDKVNKCSKMPHCSWTPMAKVSLIRVVSARFYFFKFNI